MTRASTIGFCFGLLAMATLAGCGGGGDDKNSVSGMVKFKGAPLPSGTIRFFPADKKATTSGGSPITDGRFSLSGSGGLQAGEYIVQISSQSSNAKQEALPGDSEAVGFKELIPAAYNTATKQKVTIKSGSNTYDVDIPAK